MVAQQSVGRLQADGAARRIPPDRRILPMVPKASLRRGDSEA
jgi:hypothetical protein